MTLHELKIHSQFFDAVKNGIKTNEYRMDPGHKFSVGDTIILNEINPLEQNQFTGRRLSVIITHISRHNDYEEIPEHCAVLSIRRMRRPKKEQQEVSE